MLGPRSLETALCLDAACRCLARPRVALSLGSCGVLPVFSIAQYGSTCYTKAGLPVVIGPGYLIAEPLAGEVDNLDRTPRSRPMAIRLHCGASNSLEFGAPM